MAEPEFFPRPNKPVTPRSASKPERNILTDTPGVIPWPDLEAYIKESRERIIADLAEAEDLRGLYQAQGKLALVDELLNLRAIMATLDAAGKE